MKHINVTELQVGNVIHYYGHDNTVTEILGYSHDGRFGYRTNTGMASWTVANYQAQAIPTRVTVK